MLEIENLKTNFNTYDGVVKALDGVNLKIKDGEIFGLVGETGSGKSVTCYSALKLLPKAGEIVDGTLVSSFFGIIKRRKTKCYTKRLNNSYYWDFCLVPLVFTKEGNKVVSQDGSLTYSITPNGVESLSNKERRNSHIVT